MGNSGDGTLNIEAGGVVSNATGFIGTNAGSTGVATVTGTGSQWNNSSDLLVGDSGDGTLNIEAGGVVSNTTGFIGDSAGSTGMVTVTGTGSTWNSSGSVYVGGSSTGAGGTATLTLLAGGTVQVGGTLKIWDDGTVNLFGGTLKVADTSSIDNTTGTFAFGSGVLELQGDSTITPTFLNAVLGGSSLNLGQELRVLGEPTFVTPLAIDGGQFTSNTLSQAALLQLNSGTLHVTNQAITIEPAGPFGDTLNLASNMTVQIDQGLTNNGLVTGDGTIGGNFTNSVSGVVRVSSGQSLDFTGATNTNAGKIEAIGGEVEFTADLTNAASTGLIVGRDAILRFTGGLTNNGSLALSFGTSDVFGDVTNSATGVLAVAGNSQVTFYDDVANSGVLNVVTGSTTVFLGALTGSGNVGGGDVQALGDLAPGASPGVMEFGGDLLLGPLSTLEAEIGGTVPGSQFDQVNVAGNVALGGTLDVQLIGGFVPTAGDMFEIMTAASILGTFAVEALPALPGSLEWFVNYSATSVELISTFAGDFDFNGEVNGFDFLAWQRGESPNPLSQSDLAAWKANYGTVAPLAATSTSVPEPGSLALLAMGVALVCGARKPKTGPQSRK